MRKFITETIIISKEELIGKIQQYVQEATGYNGSIKINLIMTSVLSILNLVRMMEVSNESIAYNQSKNQE